MACDYGVCGDCNAFDLITVMLVRHCYAIWAIHTCCKSGCEMVTLFDCDDGLTAGIWVIRTGCKSGCEMVTPFDSDIDDWPQCDCEQHSP